MYLNLGSQAYEHEDHQGLSDVAQLIGTLTKTEFGEKLCYGTPFFSGGERITLFFSFL